MLQLCFVDWALCQENLNQPRKLITFLSDRPRSLSLNQSQFESNLFFFVGMRVVSGSYCVSLVGNQIGRS